MKVWICKNPARNTLSNGFLLISVCYVAHTAILAEELCDVTCVNSCSCNRDCYMTQCAKIIVGLMANFGKVFLSNVHRHFSRFYVFNVLFIFIWTFITSMASARWRHDVLWCRPEWWSRYTPRWRKHIFDDVVVNDRHLVAYLKPSSADLSIRCQLGNYVSLPLRTNSSQTRDQLKVPCVTDTVGSRRSVSDAFSSSCQLHARVWRNCLPCHLHVVWSPRTCWSLIGQ